MDPVRAQRMSTELDGRHVGGWTIGPFKGAGKSAVVFEAEKEGQKAALKIFDPELVERFGKSTQLERIHREQRLIGKHHPNLVEIFDGGECLETGYLFVAMEFIAAPDLGGCLTLVPRDKIGPILQDIASAARFLEEQGLAHRDIKPENIAVFPDFSKAVLLDLGVLRPMGNPGLTDDDARPFIGTLRYSSPEFLLRQEIDSIEGWRAITFYQLGAVLHDLIMRRPLFIDFSEPYARLVEAVLKEIPEIVADDVSPNLVLLAQNCLVKSPDVRLKLLSWDDFYVGERDRSTMENAKERVRQRGIRGRLQANQVATSIEQSAANQALTVCMRLESLLRDECVGNSDFPPVQILAHGGVPPHVVVEFAPSPTHELPQALSLRFECELLDAASLTVNILVSACILPTGRVHGDPPERFSIFRGPLESDAITPHIQDAIYCAVDLAQRQDAAEAPTFSALWLDLGQPVEA